MLEIRHNGKIDSHSYQNENKQHSEEVLDTHTGGSEDEQMQRYDKVFHFVREALRFLNLKCKVGLSI